VKCTLTLNSGAISYQYRDTGRRGTCQTDYRRIATTPGWLAVLEGRAVRRVRQGIHVLDDVDDVKAELDAALGVVRPRIRQAAHSEVAVSEKMYPQAVILLTSHHHTRPVQNQLANLLTALRLSITLSVLPQLQSGTRSWWAIHKTRRSAYKSTVKFCLFTFIRTRCRPSGT